MVRSSGLTNCNEGWGDDLWPFRREIKGTTGPCDKNQKHLWAGLSDGLLQFKPSNPNHPGKVVDELALLLTAGRLSKQTRTVLVGAYTDIIGEASIDIPEMVKRESAKNVRQGAQCPDITDKTECCKYKETRHQGNEGWDRARNCIPGTYSKGSKNIPSVCEPEGWAGMKYGGLMEPCHLEPLASFKAGGWDGGWNAIDGLSGGTKSDRAGCIHTWPAMADPWLKIDLGKKVSMTSIVLHNRKDCCGNQNDGIAIYVDDKLVHKDVPMQTTGEVKRLAFKGQGQILKFVRPGDKAYLTLCEVDVFAALKPASDGTYPRNTPAEDLALKTLLKLFAAAPDFHTSGGHEATTTARPAAKKLQSQGRKFKAVVVVFLEGGADSFNIVVPHSGCKRPRSAENDPTLAPRRVAGGQSCLTTPSCRPVSNKLWCKSHADTLGVKYAAEQSGTHATSNRPAGCFYYSPTKQLEFNTDKVNSRLLQPPTSFGHCTSRVFRCLHVLVFGNCRCCDVLRLHHVGACS